MVPAGVLLRAKPAGPTSHDVVAEVRRALPRGTKVGHAGTLDPFATGLLLVLVGRATRAQRFLMELPKTYRAEARLGWTSDTGDREGELVETSRIPERLEIATGTRLQRPPAYSAVKLAGRRAYELARRGEAVETQARPVTVHRAVTLWREGERAAFEIECSAGTYVRTLIADLGDAYCERLERTAIGPFRLEDAIEGELPEDVAAALVPLGEALAFLPERPLGEDEAIAVRHGRRVSQREAEPRRSAGGPAAAGGPGTAPLGAPGLLAVRLTAGGELLAIGEPRGEELQPVVVFAPA